jgi:hypothetical protein
MSFMRRFVSVLVLAAMLVPVLPAQTSQLGAGSGGLLRLSANSEVSEIGFIKKSQTNWIRLSLVRYADGGK